MTTRRERLKQIRRQLEDLMDAGELVTGALLYPQPHCGPTDAWLAAHMLLLLADSLERERDRRGEASWQTRADFCARELERFAEWWDARESVPTE